ncbi:hypothetical protein KFU94_05245 [Chloroflexi bacterium TSY]|nr:hypothetical protein [Chloroflexi bacterium TSY]
MSAVLQTVAYADVFDFAISAEEIHRYLINIPASIQDIRATLSKLVPHSLFEHNGYYTLPNRQSNIDVRQQRERNAESLWPYAITYGQAIARLPFVRMIAVTGSLAVDNVDSDADIDYLIVTKPGRLWICRALVIQFVVKPAAKRGHIVCPNYFMTEQALTLYNHNLYTARELAQMIPLFGLDIYQEMRHKNRWTTQFLPNADGLPRAMPMISISGLNQRLTEVLVPGLFYTLMDKWEMSRKVRKFKQEYPDSAEVNFSPDLCKGHFDTHGQSTLQAHHQRVARLEPREQ